RRRVEIQNEVIRYIGISQRIFSVKEVSIFSRSRRKTNKCNSKHSAMIRKKETLLIIFIFFFFQAEDGIRDYKVTGVQTCALPIYCQEKADSSGRSTERHDSASCCRQEFDYAGADAPARQRDQVQIGRASCRERV